MKSESSIRKQRKLLQERKTHGPKEEAAREAMIGALTWVLNQKDTFTPESHCIDAFIDDNYHEVGPESCANQT